MRDQMNATEWQMGMIWLPGFVPHVSGVYLTVKLNERHPKYQWLLAAIGLALQGFMCIFIPFCKTFGSLMIPISGICFGTFDVEERETLTHRVIRSNRKRLGRHRSPTNVGLSGGCTPYICLRVSVSNSHSIRRPLSHFRSVYAIADISYSLAYALGPIVAGSIVYTTNFLTLNLLIFVSNIAYAPVLYFLRNFYAYKPMGMDETASFAHQPLHNEPDNDDYVRSISNHNYSTSNALDPSSDPWPKSTGAMGMTKENQYPQLNMGGQQAAVHFQSKSRNPLSYDEF